MYKKYKENLSEKNCNARLTELYEIRDHISEEIDYNIYHRADTLGLEAQYAEIVDIINDLCIWRKEHPGCLLKGDEGYSTEL